jgi:hypothetical protein
MSRSFIRNSCTVKKMKKIFAFVSLSAVLLGGCSKSTKYIEAENVIANVSVRAVYVPRLQAVQIKVPHQDVSFLIRTSETFMHVADDALRMHVERFNFGDYLNRTREAWVKQLATNSSTTCRYTKLSFEVKDMPYENARMHVQASFTQHPTGRIQLRLRHGEHGEILFAFVIPARRDVDVSACVQSWRTSKELAGVAIDLLGLRERFAHTLADPSLLDADTKDETTPMTKVKRNPNSIDTDPQKV